MAILNVVSKALQACALRRSSGLAEPLPHHPSWPLLAKAQRFTTEEIDDYLLMRDRQLMLDNAPITQIVSAPTDEADEADEADVAGDLNQRLPECTVTDWQQLIGTLLNTSTQRFILMFALQFPSCLEHRSMQLQSSSGASLLSMPPI